MRVLIFTEGGTQIGLGHLSRCSSLYDELEDRGIEVEFIVYGNIYKIDILQNRKYRMKNWITEKFLSEFIQQDDYCIVDSYLADEKIFRIISRLSKNSVFIDDTARLEYPKGVVVNPSLSADYADSRNKQVLSGPDYIMLRRPFIFNKRQRVNKFVKKILVTLGGTDVKNLTSYIVQTLINRDPYCVLNIVIGKENQLLEFKSSPNINVYSNVSAEEMNKIMVESDIAITAAGQTIYELIATRTPFIPIQVIDNQYYNMQNLKNLYLINSYINYSDESLEQKLVYELERLMNYGNRLDLIKLYKKVIDGLGSKRIIDALISG